MSAVQNAPACNAKLNLQQQIKVECYRILQANQKSLWQNFVLSMISHINFGCRVGMAKGKIDGEWVRDQIQAVLKWISDPKNRLVQGSFRVKEQRWVRERKEWEASFERFLTSHQELKQRYEMELESIEEKNRQLKKQKEQAIAKNSVLQSIIKICLGKETSGARIKSRPQNKPVRLSICNPSHVSLKSLDKSDCFTMTYNLIPILNDDELPAKEREKDIIVEKRVTNVTENQEIQEEDSSFSSSSCVQECDRWTQTVICQTISQESQTEMKMVDETTLRGLLLRLSLLQSSLEEKNDEISQKQRRIKQIQSTLEVKTRQISELKQQLRIGAQIQAHLTSKYEESKQLYEELNEKYREMMSMMASYVEGSPPQPKLHQFSQTMPVHELKVESQDDQLLTTESEGEEGPPQDELINKGIILRYLLEFVKLEAEGGSIDKRMTVLATALSVLGLRIEDEPIVQQLLQKNRLKTQSPSPSFQTKLYKYLTQQL